MIKNKSSTKLFFFINLLISIYLCINFNRSLEFTDESFHLLRSLYPLDEIGRITNFGILNNIILKISNYDIFFLRVVGFIFLTLCNIFLCNSFFDLLSQQFSIENHKDKYLVLLFSWSGSFAYYFYWMPTPSYNLFNLCGILLFLGGVFKIWNNKSLISNFIAFFSIIAGGLLCFVSKIPTSIFLCIIFFFFLIFVSKFKNKKKFNLIFLLISTTLFLLFLFTNYFYLSIDSFLQDVIFGVKVYSIRDDRYGVLKIITTPLKEIIYFVFITNYFQLFFFSILFYILRFVKKNEIFFFYFLIIFLLFFREPIVSLFISIAYFFIFKRHIITKKIIIFLLLLFLVMFSFSFGTNTNFIRHLNYINILFFLLFYFFFILLIREKKIFTLVFSLFLTIYNITTVIIAFKKPLRLTTGINEQNKSISIPYFKNNLYVDKKTEEYILRLQLLARNHKWQEGNYLIDLTGRLPGANLAIGAKFIAKPWYLSGYKGSNSWVEELLKKTDYNLVKNSWILTWNSSPQIDRNVLKVHNIELEKDYICVGKIQSINHTVNNFNYDYLWKPKILQEEKNNPQC
jgi:hypothetical protein